MMRSGWRFRNPLIRRVQRHASVSVLFRSPWVAPGGEGAPAKPWAASLLAQKPASVPVASAWLAPTPPPGQTEVEPGAMPVSLPLDRAQQEIPAGQPPNEAPKPGAPPLTVPSAPISRSTVVPQAEGEAPKPAPAGAESQEADGEGIWKRLQTIFRKHEERRLSEEKTPAESEAPLQVAQDVEQPSLETLAEPEKTTLLPLPSPVVMRKAMSEESPPAEPARADQTPAEVEPAPLPVPKVQPGAPPVPAKAQEKTFTGEARQAVAPVREPKAHPAVQREDDMPVRSRVEIGQPVPGVPLEPTSNPTAASGILAGAEGEPPAGQALPRGKSPAAAEPPGLPQPVVPIPPASPPEVLGESEEPLNQTLQSLPLEAAWPVQRQVAEAPQAASLPSPASEPAPEILSFAEHAQVREALREVVPGQPTDSPVEVITPRRPRPAQATLREKPPSSPASAGGQQEIEDHPSEINLVPTAIGALPADLWNLIEESPPAQPEDGLRPAGQGGIPGRTSPQTPAPDGTLTAQRLAEQAALPAVEPRAASPLEPGRTVQRSPEPVTGSDASATGSAPATGSAASAEAETAAGRASPAQPSDKDLDELAARVYGEVKKRLAVEWERMRRRF